MNTSDQVADAGPRLDPVAESVLPPRTRPRSLDEFVALVANVTGATGAALALEATPGEVVCVARMGVGAPEIGTSVKEAGIVAECFRTGAIQRCDDASSDDRIDQAFRVESHIQSLLAVPLRQGKAVQGVVCVYSHRRAHFDERDVIALEYLQSVAARLLNAKGGTTSVVAAAPAKPQADEPAMAPAGPELFATWAQPERSSSSLHVVAVALAVVLLGGFAFAGYWYGRARRRGSLAHAATTTASAQGATADSAGQTVAPVADSSAPPSTAASGPGQVQAIDSEQISGAVRISIRVDHAVPYVAFRLDHPDRLCVDLQETRFAPGVHGQSIALENPLVRGIRSSQYKENVVRVVLDLAAPEAYQVQFANNPARWVIDIGSPKPTPAGAVSTPAKTGDPSAQVTPAEPLVIALDPGHGGDDSGVIGRHGLREKQLVLDIALRLGALLESHLGAKVIYTRDDDRLVPLDKRAAAANAAGANLLVSIHANGSSYRSAQGIETYYLEAATARENSPAAESVPRGEYAMGRKGVNASRLRQSRMFAQRVQASLYNGLRSDHVRNRGVRTAPLLVLKGAQMPAVLVEISFLSSPDEERRLASDEYRNQIAQALFQGIRRQVASTRHKPQLVRTAAAGQP